MLRRKKQLLENTLLGQFRFNIIFIVMSNYSEFQNAEFELFQ